MPPAPLHCYTFEEYLAIEEVARVRHEFLNGEIYAMAGGTPEHATMSAAITALMSGQLAGKPCRVYSSHLRVRVQATGLATYPDVTVVWGPSQRDPASPTHVINPTVLFEVLSDGTESYDRGEKLEQYKQIPSLQAIVLFDHRKPLVEVWKRTDQAWSLETATGGQTVDLPVIASRLPVDSVYAAAREA